MSEKEHRISSHYDSSRHRHHRDDDRIEDRKRREEKSRSPSSSRRRHHHHHNHHHRDKRGKEEDETEMDARKRRDRYQDERESKHHKSEQRHTRKEESSSNYSKEPNLKVIDDGLDDVVPQREMFIDSDTSRFEASTSNIPSSESLGLQSHPKSTHSSDPVPLPKEPATVSSMKRDDWMLAEHREVGKKEENDTSSADYFTDLGTVSRIKAPKADKPNPDNLKVSSREINTQFAEGRHLDEYEMTSAIVGKPGGPGHQWRMMKLKRVYEAAEEENRDVEEVALERYGTVEAFNEARAERQYLDDQRVTSHHRQGGSRQLVGDVQSETRPPPPSRPLSRQVFRKPGESSSASSTQHLPPAVAVSKRQSSFRQNGYDSENSSKPSTPIPNVFTPTLSRVSSKLLGLGSENENSSSIKEALMNSQASEINSNPPLSAAALNKLSAKVIRAEMMGSNDAAELRAQLDSETARAQSGGDHGFSDAANASHQIGETREENHVQVLPTLDARGRLYDVGKGQSDQDEVAGAGNRRKSGKFDTRDAKTGELTRYNADDDDYNLADLVRQERFGAGSADQKNADAEMAVRITSDQAFKDNIDYMDKNVERLARKKMKTDAMKRQFAVQDFARTKKALDSCQYCWQEEGARPPRASVISSGTRSYLAVPSTEVLTLGHCLIVPMQHHLTSLEVDDDSWEEIKNFMKCLMQMAASHKQGMIFFETVKSLKHQRHTVIEAIPVDSELFQQMPGYFKQSILTIGDEWSQNKKLIEFSPSKSFRKTMVSQLPYFMVQWDYKGEKGYGHIIEDGDGHDGAGGGDGFEMAESSKGGGDFPSWFAAEIIGNLLDLEPRRWRKPKRMHSNEQSMQVSSFRKIWNPFDWTVALG